GHGEVGDDRAVGKADERVDDALGVDHGVYPLVGQVEEPMGLDDLQALVHQGGGVDGDFAPHAPGGVSHRLFDGDCCQFSRGGVAEGAAGGGQGDPFDLGLLVSNGEALPDGAVLAVDGTN